jgi:hypothetical protein
MTHHVQFPPYLPRGKIDGEPHPVDAAERPVLGQRVPGIEYHVLAVVQRILRQKTLARNGNASQPLCLSEIKFAHTDDEVRQEMAWAKCDQRHVPFAAMNHIGRCTYLLAGFKPKPKQ